MSRKITSILGILAAAVLMYGCPSQQQDTPPATQDTTEADTAIPPEDTVPADTQPAPEDTVPEF
ncbi:MAG: hypothetical protein ACLFVQ_03780 [Chitinispirillaceae bacterium]